MMKYPYIQSKKKINNFICEGCKKLIEQGFLLEWRVDWFQGNCEFEKNCQSCMDKQIMKIRKHHDLLEKQEIRREEAYQKRMQPRWDKLYTLLLENRISVKKYPQTGQMVFNDLIDWWTTTGTAIHRKTKQRFYFSINNPEKIIKELINQK